MARIESKSGQSKPGFRERVLRWSERASEITIPAGLGLALVTAFFSAGASAAFLGGAGLDWVADQQVQETRKNLEKKRLARSGDVYVAANQPRTNLALAA